jgi:hypothetical protein
MMTDDGGKGGGMSVLEAIGVGVVVACIMAWALGYFDVIAYRLTH